MFTEYNTKRLVLRVLKPDWAAEILDFYIRNQEYFEPWEPDRTAGFYTPEYQAKMLYYDYLAFEKGTQIRYWIFLKGYPHMPIGTVSFHNITHGVFQSCVLGYKIDHEYTHQGYCLEAVQSACTIMFTDYKLHRIEAMIHTHNTPSMNFIKSWISKRRG